MSRSTNCASLIRFSTGMKTLGNFLIQIVEPPIFAKPCSLFSLRCEAFFAVQCAYNALTFRANYPLLGCTPHTGCSMPKGCSILVVEDDLVHQKLLKRKLAQDAELFPILEFAATASEAAILARQLEFDCFLVDHQLPSVTGLELIQQLQAEGHEGPFILMTSAGSEDLVIEAYRHNVRHYLAKDVVFWNELPTILTGIMETAASERADTLRSTELVAINERLDEVNTSVQERVQSLLRNRTEIRERLATVVEALEVNIEQLTDTAAIERLRAIRRELVGIAALARD